MDSLKSMLRIIAGYTIEILGILVFIYVWIYGAVGIYNNQQFGHEFRILLDRTWEGEELDVVSKPRPRSSYK